MDLQGLEMVGMGAQLVFSPSACSPSLQVGVPLLWKNKDLNSQPWKRVPLLPWAVWLWTSDFPILALGWMEKGCLLQLSGKCQADS